MIDDPVLRRSVAAANKRLKRWRAEDMNDDSFTSAPQLTRDPLGRCPRFTP